jgi:hypothetical protein
MWNFLTNAGTTISYFTFFARVQLFTFLAETLNLIGSSCRRASSAERVRIFQAADHASELDLSIITIN